MKGFLKKENVIEGKIDFSNIFNHKKLNDLITKEVIVKMEVIVKHVSIYKNKFVLIM